MSEPGSSRECFRNIPTPHYSSEIIENNRRSPCLFKVNCPIRRRLWHAVGVSAEQLTIFCLWRFTTADFRRQPNLFQFFKLKAGTGNHLANLSPGSLPAVRWDVVGAGSPVVLISGEVHIVPRFHPPESPSLMPATWRGLGRIVVDPVCQAEPALALLTSGARVVTARFAGR